LSNVEDEELEAVKSTRSWVEYLWTLTPSVLMWALRRCNFESVAYIDADLYFTAPLDPLYAEVKHARSAIIPHRWTPRHAERLRPNGIYNVSWVYVDWRAAQFLAEWRERCNSWCYNSNNGQGVGDQGHLDALQPEYGCRVVEHLGANLAPWNQEQYSYEWRDGNLYIDGKDPLLFYHFHEFLHNAKGEVLRRTGYPVHPMVAEHVYKPYEAEIRGVCNEFMAR
jgi:hypothetical protein